MSVLPSALPATEVVIEIRFLDWWFQFDPTTFMVRLHQDGSSGWSRWSRPLHMDARNLRIDIGIEIVPVSEADCFRGRAKKGEPING